MKTSLFLLLTLFITVLSATESLAQANSSAETTHPTSLITNEVTTVSTEKAGTASTEKVTTAETEKVTTAETEKVTTASTERLTTASTEEVVTTSTEEVTTTSSASETTLSTTPASSSTGEPPVTTSSPVTTEAPPQKCSWNITSGNTTCIRADLTALFIIPNEAGNSTIKVKLGCEADDLKSECGVNETQTLVLADPKQQYTLTMIFVKKDGNVFVQNITLDYALPGGESGSVKSDKDLFSVKAGSSYLCKTKRDVKLENVTMEILEIQLQAFGAKDNSGFGSPVDCDPPGPKVGDAVPIAVGVALLVLILVVLIAYLIGRRRSQQKGYQSFQS